MEKQRTVLILGAGASNDAAGFPTGHELLDIICEGMRTSGGILTLQMRNAGFNPPELLAFRKQLKSSNCTSVDEFLQSNKHWEKIGKAAMAAELLKCEANSAHESGKLFHTSPEEYSWYKELLKRLFAHGIDGLNDNTLSIVTFNYDRSLEHCLFESAKNRYAIDRKGPINEQVQQCIDNIDAIPIVHVYGSLGRLPWQNSGSWVVNESLQYGAPIDTTTIRTCIRNIRIISETDIKADGDQGFIEARTQINQANRVLFLGFGYNTINVSRLQLGNVKRFGTLEGTSMGMTNERRRQIQKDLFQAVPVLLNDTRGTREQKETKKGDHNCLDFIRHMGVL